MRLFLENSVTNRKSAFSVNGSCAFCSSTCVDFSDFYVYISVERSATSTKRSWTCCHRSRKFIGKYFKLATTIVDGNGQLNKLVHVEGLINRKLTATWTYDDWKVERCARLTSNSDERDHFNSVSILKNVK